ncbi:unnamed protein product [Heterobilharzia americana]|nr:unnamed protein product [Heterobilharzia americana]CAH8511012.1 unnamed protein product [Heterobilharzia americana]
MSDKHFARLCTIHKWDNYSGYGFSLQATKGKIGHYITEVDHKSPAYAAGLRDEDFVVEVNGINVVAEQHQSVVQRILKDPLKVSLLVLDPDSKSYFEMSSIPMDSSMMNVKKMKCPPSNQSSSDVPVVNGHSKLFSEDNQLSNQLENMKLEKIDESTLRPSSHASSMVSTSENDSSEVNIRNISPTSKNEIKNERNNSVLSPQNTNIPQKTNSVAKYDDKQKVESKRDSQQIDLKTSVLTPRKQKRMSNSLNFTARAKIVDEL